MTFLIEIERCLLDAGGKLTHESLETLRALREAGHRIVLLTTTTSGAYYDDLQRITHDAYDAVVMVDSGPLVLRGVGWPDQAVEGDDAPRVLSITGPVDGGISDLRRFIDTANNPE